MTEPSQFQVRQTLNVNGSVRTIDFTIEKDAIFLQIRENEEEKLNIRVQRTREQELNIYTFTISVTSKLSKHARVDLVTSVQDDVGFHWFSWPHNTITKLVEERGLTYVTRQFTRDIFNYLEKSAGVIE
jgi:hypothetical protein